MTDIRRELALEAFFRLLATPLKMKIEFIKFTWCLVQVAGALAYALRNLPTTCATRCKYPLSARRFVHLRAATDDWQDKIRMSYQSIEEN